MIPPFPKKRFTKQETGLSKSHSRSPFHSLVDETRLPCVATHRHTLRGSALFVVSTGGSCRTFFRKFQVSGYCSQLLNPGKTIPAQSDEHSVDQPFFHESTARGDETLGLLGYHLFHFHESFRVLDPSKPIHLHLDIYLSEITLVTIKHYISSIQAKCRVGIQQFDVQSPKH